MPTIEIKLTEEEHLVLTKAALERGVSIDALLHQAVCQLLPQPGSKATLPNDEWEAQFNEWLDGQGPIPALPDQALSRKSIYTREDEWR